MFTGIIKELGQVQKITRINTGLEIQIGCSTITSGMNLGDSVAVNGCCLTVKEFGLSYFKADISFSTLKSTTFGSMRAGDKVNLEEAITLKDRLGGHVVTGHIDDVGKITDVKRIGDFYKLEVKIPKNLLEFAAPKGSFTVDGISLTISDININNLDFAIIPFTFENTNLKFKNPGNKVNLEVDLMARYLINMAKYGGTTAQAMEYLKILDKKDDIKNISKERDKQLEEKLKKYGFK
jgi:riboflavin synthase